LNSKVYSQLIAFNIIVQASTMKGDTTMKRFVSLLEEAVSGYEGKFGEIIHEAPHFTG
jgi:hypothetical protein